MVSIFQSFGIDEGFEGRAGLAESLPGTVELVVIAPTGSADHGSDRPAVVFDQHQGGVVDPVAGARRADRRGHDRFGFSLEIEIQSRVDLQTLAIEILLGHDLGSFSNRIGREVRRFEKSARGGRLF